MKLAPMRVFSCKHPLRMCSIGCVAEEDYIQLLLHISCTVIYYYFFLPLECDKYQKILFQADFDTIGCNKTAK